MGEWLCWLSGEAKPLAAILLDKQNDQNSKCHAVLKESRNWLDASSHEKNDFL